MTTIINLASGQSVRTTDDSAADIAGLINANVANPPGQAIYECTDIDAQSQRYIVASHIESVYETD